MDISGYILFVDESATYTIRNGRQAVLKGVNTCSLSNKGLSFKNLDGFLAIFLLCDIVRRSSKNVMAQMRSLTFDVKESNSVYKCWSGVTVILQWTHFYTN